MFTPYNLALPSVLYPVREVPLFAHQVETASAPKNDPRTHSTPDKSRSSDEVPQEAIDHNEWSTFAPDGSSISSTTGRHGWLHIPHIPHPHIDLSYLRHKHVAVPPPGKITSARQSQSHQAEDYHKIPYLPHSTLWPAHLFPSGSPFHHLHHQRSGPNDTVRAPTDPSTTTPINQPISHTPAASVTQLPKHYILELDAPGLPACDSSTTPDEPTAATISVTWLSPRTVLVSGRTPPTLLALDDALDGGELCRTPTREEGPPADLGARGEGNKEEKVARVLFSERVAAEWRRSFTLPSDAVVGVDPSEEVGGSGGIRWEVEDGVVRVWVPRG